MNINYLGIRPARNYRGEIYGTFLQQVQSINPAGMIMEWMKSQIARKQAQSILKMIDYLQTNEILEYEQSMLMQSQRFKEVDDFEEIKAEMVVERPGRFQDPAHNRQSNRQGSNQHFYHKQEDPLYYNSQNQNSLSPTGAVKIGAFAPRRKFGYSLSPDHAVPMQVSQFGGKEQPSTINVVKVSESELR